MSAVAEAPLVSTRAAAIPSVYAWLSLIIAAYVVVAFAYARATPAWQSPDEPAHFNYVQYVAQHAALPVLQQGDYPDGVVPLAPQTRPADVSAFRYEAHQPPLFYLLGAVVYKLHPSLMALRALSILFGAALLPVAFWCARLAAPGAAWLWLGVAAFIAFLPMHLFIAGSVENDTLAELILSLLLLAYLARWPWPVFGLLLGLAVLTKLTIYVPALALVALAFLRERAFTPSLNREGAGERVLALRPFRAAAMTAVIAAAVSGWWLIRNGLTYGWGDLLVQQRQAQVAGSQLHTAAYDLPALERFVVVGFQSFWGQFGWMSIPLHAVQYEALAAISLLACLGAALAIKRMKPWALAGMVATGTGVLAGLVGYNLTFVQPQGRYMFPALVPIGMVYAGGLGRFVPERARGWAIGLLALAMAAFAVYILRRQLMPSFQ